MVPMNDRAPDILASSVQKTSLWLKDVAYELRTPSRHKAYSALRSVLHALRACVPIDQLAKFSAQLPLFITGVLFDGWKPRRKPVRFTRSSFHAQVQAELHGTGLDARLAVRAALLALSRHVSAGELRSLRQILPREVRDMWQELENAGRDEVIRPRAERPQPADGEPRWTQAVRRPWRPSDRYQGGGPSYGPR